MQIVILKLIQRPFNRNMLLYELKYLICKPGRHICELKRNY